MPAAVKFYGQARMVAHIINWQCGLRDRMSSIVQLAFNMLPEMESINVSCKTGVEVVLAVPVEVGIKEMDARVDRFRKAVLAL